MRPTAADVPLSFAVIIPAFNVEGTLGAQLDALTHQRWDGTWGIVVVDNGSTDGTRAVAERYRDAGVRVVEATGGQGVAYARNAGVAATRAATFAFCDGDDIVHPGWVPAMADALRTAELVSGRVETQSLNPTWLADTRPMSTTEGTATFGATPFASGCNSGMTREVFELLGGFDESFVGLEDIEFSLRAAAHGITVEFVPEAIIAYRLREEVRDVWRQARYYGRGRPELRRRAVGLGLAPPRPMEGVKSWLWLGVHLPALRTRSGRYRWLWVLGNRIGVIEGHRGRMGSRP